MKYGLHQKAVDHLRRVFALDPENVEAHERLKDIFMSQGREQEAEVELLKLAELVASGDPDRAEVYLQELLAMNGTHTGAFELARRFRLRVARMSSVSAEVDYGGGSVSAVDVDLDDLDLAAPPRAVGIARSKRDSVDDFDPDELIGGRVAHGSPAPGRPPAPPENFELEFEPSPSQSTRQLSPAQVDALHNYDEEAAIIDRPHRWTDDGMAPTRFDEQVPDAALLDAVEAQLEDDQQLDDEIASELATAHVGEDLPFDPDEARAFDAAVNAGETDAVDVTGFEETSQPPPATQGYDDVSEDPLSVSGSYDPYGTESVHAAPAFDSTAAHAAAPEMAVGIDELDDAPRNDSNVEDDLDEADFYSSQHMYVEAMDVLRNRRRATRSTVDRGKLREAEASRWRGDRGAAEVAPEIEHEFSSSTDAIDLDEIEEVDADEFEEVHSEIAPSPIKKRGPSVTLQRPVDEGDADTHYDLGLAYKEMGLHDEAIKAFEKTLRAPGREVQCRVMIGMCQREMGNPSEAIHQFKAGLHAEPNERERQSIYYEIGNTYESLGDEAEALYFFDMVIKRDPSFADASNRAEQLRNRVGRGVRPRDEDL